MDISDCVDRLHGTCQLRLLAPSHPFLVCLFHCCWLVVGVWASDPRLACPPTCHSQPRRARRFSCGARSASTGRHMLCRLTSHSRHQLQSLQDAPTSPAHTRHAFPMPDASHLSQSSLPDRCLSTQMETAPLGSCPCCWIQTGVAPAHQRQLWMHAARSTAPSVAHPSPPRGPLARRHTPAQPPGTPLSLQALGTPVRNRPWVPGTPPHTTVRTPLQHRAPPRPGQQQRRQLPQPPAHGGPPGRRLPQQTSPACPASCHAPSMTHLLPRADPHAQPPVAANPHAQRAHTV